MVLDASGTRVLAVQEKSGQSMNAVERRGDKRAGDVKEGRRAIDSNAPSRFDPIINLLPPTPTPVP